MALLVVVVLLITGTSFLMFLERDYRFAGVQERSEQAWFLALAGLEYHRANPESATPEAPLRRHVPADDPRRYFELTVTADGTLTCRGVVEGTLVGGGTVERTVVVPRGAIEEAYDAGL